MAIEAASRAATGSARLNQEGIFLRAMESLGDSLLESLYRKGLLVMSEKPALHAGWQEALKTLCDPIWDLSAILGREGDLHYDRYFASTSLDAESLVFCRPDGEDGWDIAFPYGPAYLRGMIDETLSLTPGPPPPEHSVDFNYKEYILLAALVDVLRRRSLEGLLRHEPVNAGEIGFDEILAAVEDGLRHGDTRWMVALGNTVSPFEFSLQASDLEGLMRALQLRGFVVAGSKAGRIVPTDALTELAASLRMMPAFAAFELTFIKAADVFEINYFAAVRGLDTVWLFDFFELATAFPRVSLMQVNGEELGMMVDKLFEESCEKSERLLLSRKQAVRVEQPVEATRAPSPPTLRGLKAPPTMGKMAGVAQPEPARATVVEIAAADPAPAAEVSGGAVPPSPERPAEPVAAAPAETPCRTCGLPVIVGKKFCRHCGKPMPAESPPPQPVAAPPPFEPLPPAAPVPTFPVAPPVAAAMTVCQICGLALPETARFCGHCGANVALFRQAAATPQADRTCPSCSGKLAANAKFCAFCGYRVA